MESITKKERTNFTWLNVWSKATGLTLKINEITKGKEFTKDSYLRTQIMRSIVSVSTNIAVWYEKRKNFDLAQYLWFAKDTCPKILSLLLMAKQLGYVNGEELAPVLDDLENLTTQLSKFKYVVENPRKKEESKQTEKTKPVMQSA